LKLRGKHTFNDKGIGNELLKRTPVTKEIREKKLRNGIASN
jgi:hypothetical protein